MSMPPPTDYDIEIGRVGIVRLAWSDPYWPDDSLARYVQLMANRSEMHGRKLGRAISVWAVTMAGQGGKQFLRPDCLASNGRLHRYYEDLGFVYRGAFTDRDYRAALYEKEV